MNTITLPESGIFTLPRHEQKKAWLLLRNNYTLFYEFVTNL